MEAGEGPRGTPDPFRCREQVGGTLTVCHSGVLQADSDWDGGPLACVKFSELPAVGDRSGQGAQDGSSTAGDREGIGDPEPPWPLDGWRGGLDLQDGHRSRSLGDDKIRARPRPVRCDQPSGIHRALTGSLPGTRRHIVEHDAAQIGNGCGVGECRGCIASAGMRALSSAFFGGEPSHPAADFQGAALQGHLCLSRSGSGPGRRPLSTWPAR